MQTKVYLKPLQVKPVIFVKADDFPECIVLIRGEGESHIVGGTILVLVRQPGESSHGNQRVLKAARNIIQYNSNTTY